MVPRFVLSGYSTLKSDKDWGLVTLRNGDLIETDNTAARVLLVTLVKLYQCPQFLQGNSWRSVTCLDRNTLA